MSDPRPWLEEGASGDLKSLLESARLDEPAPERLASVSAKLLPLLAASAAATAASGGTAAAAGTAKAAAGAAAKVGLSAKVLVGLTTVAAMGGAFQAGRVYEVKTAPPRPAEVRIVEKIVEVPAALPPVVAEEPAAVDETPPPVKPVKVAPRPDVEVALLEQAMKALSSGDAKKALALTEQHGREFKGGLLEQEREVLAIEALVKLGRKAEAKTRGEKFRQRYPTSTHLLKVEGLISD